MNKKDLLEKESHTYDLIMVEFYADWCPHCRRMAPIVSKFQEETKGDLGLVMRINIDEEEALADEYEVDTIPTFILMRKGEQLWRQSGEISIDKLEKAVEMNKL